MQGTTPLLHLGYLTIQLFDLFQGLHQLALHLLLLLVMLGLNRLQVLVVFALTLPGQCPYNLDLLLEPLNVLPSLPLEVCLPMALHD